MHYLYLSAIVKISNKGDSMKISMSNGNQKVKATIFNLPAGKTCKSCLSCQSYCYAKKAERQYPNVLPSRNSNLESTKNELFVPEMIKRLDSKKSEFVRLHESGDFYEQGYIQKWFEIFKKTQDKHFYAYTKRDDLFSLDILSRKPKNCTLIYSIDGIITEKDIKKIEIPTGFDKIAMVHETISTCPAQKNKEVMCGRDCQICITGKLNTIVFKKH